MVLARALPLALVLCSLGCRLDNPAFEDGGDDELLDDSTSKTSESEDANESGTSVGESTSTNSSDAETSSSSSSDGSETSSSSSDGNETSTSMGESDSSTDLVEMDACPQILIIDDCLDCITSGCCLEGVNVECFSPGGCACVLDCLLAGQNLEFCKSIQCMTDVGAADKALGLLECGVQTCPGFCQ